WRRRSKAGRRGQLLARFSLRRRLPLPLQPACSASCLTASSLRGYFGCGQVNTIAWQKQSESQVCLNYVLLLLLLLSSEADWDLRLLVQILETQSQLIKSFSAAQFLPAGISNRLSGRPCGRRLPLFRGSRAPSTDLAVRPAAAAADAGRRAVSADPAGKAAGTEERMMTPRRDDRLRCMTRTGGRRTNANEDEDVLTAGGRSRIDDDVVDRPRHLTFGDNANDGRPSRGAAGAAVALCCSRGKKAKDTLGLGADLFPKSRLAHSFCIQSQSFKSLIISESRCNSSGCSQPHTRRCSGDCNDHGATAGPPAQCYRVCDCCGRWPCSTAMQLLIRQPIGSLTLQIDAETASGCQVSRGAADGPVRRQPPYYCWRRCARCPRKRLEQAACRSLKAGNAHLETILRAGL
uniref:ShKT domain-containing protein n=1 Tax=Macrostomum lignano TaxID=282301 RepID=A0A1I8F8Q4_9PLAT